MNKISFNTKFGLIALIILFLIIYGFFSIDKLSNNLMSGSGGNSDKEFTVGELGGFHKLDDITVTNENTYYRVSLHTSLNRSTTIDQTIITPYAKVKQLPNTLELSTVAEYQDISELGDYIIQATLSDTSVFGSTHTTDSSWPIDKNIAVNKDPVTEIVTIPGLDESITYVLIGLTQESRFHVSHDKSGTIFVDILK